MTSTSATHPSRGTLRRHRDHLGGNLVVVVVIGVLGLAWFAVWVWLATENAW